MEQPDPIDALRPLLPFHEQSTVDVIDNMFCDKSAGELNPEHLRSIMDAAQLRSETTPSGVCRTEICEQPNGPLLYIRCVDYEPNDRTAVTSFAFERSAPGPVYEKPADVLKDVVEHSDAIDRKRVRARSG